MRTSRSKEPAKPPHSPVSTSREGSKGAQRLKQSPAPGQKPKKKAASRAVPKPDTQVQALLKELLAQSAQTEQNVKALAGMLQAFMASVATAVPGVQSSGVSLQPGSWQTVLRVESVGTQTSRRKKQDSEQSESEESEEEPSEDEEEEDGEEGEEEGEEEGRDRDRTGREGGGG